MAELGPLYWPVAALLESYRRRELSPIDVAREALGRIEEHDDELHAFLTVTADLALEQARAAEAAYARGEESPLLGVPVSIKDAFHVRGVVTTLGSLVHRSSVAAAHSGVVRRLAAAGAVFTGKTNTAEFGQSATTDNRLGPDARNPWDPSRTPGGSSGGAAASVAAGMSSLAVGSDGGGSIRIPAAFTGLVGLKPTSGLILDEDGFRAMSDFVSPGPLAWRVADARVLLGVLADRDYPRRSAARALRVGWCARPEGRPVDRAVAEAVAGAVGVLEDLGYEVVEVALPLEGWSDIFGPLVLDDERRERGHLLAAHADLLTLYERRSLEAAERLDAGDIERAQRALPRFQGRIAGLFGDVDLLVTPTVAVPAFPLRERPTIIEGEAVDKLWGAFPFAVPFNVAGTPALSLPCGLADDLPVGVQLVGPPLGEALVLDVAQELEEALRFDPAAAVDRWRGRQPSHTLPL
jgi:Asp-tRNA(Asn)/Glu-tRNA(Gln) amidotransferase A subunit family amidase